MQRNGWQERMKKEGPRKISDLHAEVARKKMEQDRREAMDRMSSNRFDRGDSFRRGGAPAYVSSISTLAPQVISTHTHTHKTRVVYVITPPPITAPDRAWMTAWTAPCAQSARSLPLTTSPWAPRCAQEAALAAEGYPAERLLPPRAVQPHEAAQPARRASEVPTACHSQLPPPPSRRLRRWWWSARR